MKISLLFCCLLFVYSATAKRIIVDKNGQGDYESISTAANDALPGDTVYIFPGTYNEIIRPLNSGTKEFPIVYIGSKDGNVLIDALPGQEHCLQIQKKNHLKFINIRFSGAEISCVQVLGPAKHILFEEIEISGAKMYDTQDGGLHFFGKDGAVDSVIVSNSNIHSNVGHGISVLERVTHLLIDNCKIYNNGLIKGAHADNIAMATVNWAAHQNGPDFIEIRNSEIYGAVRQGISSWYANHLWVHHNRLWENGCTGIQIEDGVNYFIVEDNISYSNQQEGATETGIWIDDAKNGLVKNNVLHNNQVGLKVSRSKNIIIRNNLIYSNHRENFLKESGGIAILAYKVGDHDVNNENTAIIHNTIYGVGRDEIDFYNSIIAYFEADNSIIKNCFLYNNLFSDITNGYYTESYTWTDKMIDFHSDYNLIYDESAILNTINYSNFSIDELKSQGKENNSIFEEPGFADAENNEFNLNPQSPCIDKGRFLTKTTQTGNGKIIDVENALFFNNGYGLRQGDSIIIGNNEPVLIENVDYLNNRITVNRDLTWQGEQGVSFAYNGISPDIGAYEYDPSNVTSNSKIINTPKGFEVNIYPSPLDINSKIRFRSSYTSSVSIEISDMSGEIVEKFDMLCLAGTDYELKLMSEKFQCGYYIVTLSTEKESVSKKVVKINY